MQRIKIDSEENQNAFNGRSGNNDSSIVSEAEAISTADNANVQAVDIMGATPPGGELMQGSAPGSVAVGSLIDGKTAVELMDSILPAALVFLMYKAGIVLKKSELQLSEREKNTLAPLMSKCMDALMLNFDSPFVALGVSMAVIYGGKIMEKGGIAFIERKNSESKIKRERRKKPVERVEAALNGNPIKEEPIIEKDYDGNQFTADNIEKFRKHRRVSPAKAVPIMIRLFNEGKMDKFGNQIVK